MQILKKEETVVFALARRPDLSTSLNESKRDYGGRLHLVKVDVSDESTIQVGPSVRLEWGIHQSGKTSFSEVLSLLIKFRIRIMMQTSAFIATLVILNYGTACPTSAFSEMHKVISPASSHYLYKDR